MKIDGKFQNMFVDLSNMNEAEIKNYTQYLNSDDKLIITKGTLENVIKGHPLDLKQIAGFDSTRVQTLKQSGGTPMWVNDRD